MSVALDYNAPCYTPYGNLCFRSSRFFTRIKKTSVSCVGNRGLQAKGTQEIINRILSVLDEVDICVGLVVSLIFGLLLRLLYMKQSKNFQVTLILNSKFQGQDVPDAFHGVHTLAKSGAPIFRILDPTVAPVHERSHQGFHPSKTGRAYRE